MDEQAREQLLSCLEDVKLDLEEMGEISSAVMVAQAVEMIHGYASRLDAIRSVMNVPSDDLDDDVGKVIAVRDILARVVEKP